MSGWGTGGGSQAYGQGQVYNTQGYTAQAATTQQPAAAGQVLILPFPPLVAICCVGVTHQEDYSPSAADPVTSLSAARHFPWLHHHAEAGVVLIGGVGTAGAAVWSLQRPAAAAGDSQPSSWCCCATGCLHGVQVQVRFGFRNLVLIDLRLRTDGSLRRISVCHARSGHGLGCRQSRLCRESVRDEPARVLHRAAGMTRTQRVVPLLFQLDVRAG